MSASHLDPNAGGPEHPRTLLGLPGVAQHQPRSGPSAAASRGRREPGDKLRCRTPALPRSQLQSDNARCTTGDVSSNVGNNVPSVNGLQVLYYVLEGIYFRKLQPGRLAALPKQRQQHLNKGAKIKSPLRFAKALGWKSK